MGAIWDAIEYFREKRLDVYKVDAGQIVRDARSAERATKDHVGRWLFELLQNCDDAKATEVRIHFNNNAIYVADSGVGLCPSAVSAICGTDYSDKSAGMIGRKGVGFKSVYDVSRNPQVLTVNGEGIEFDVCKAKDWLKSNGFDGEHVPYQWIPFPILWDKALELDSDLETFSSCKTVVVLRGIQAEKMRAAGQLLKEWPPHSLFAFRNVRRIEAPELEIILTEGNGVWSISDTRGVTPNEWQVYRYAEIPPGDLLKNLSGDERSGISSGGVSFLIATPREDGSFVPTTDYLPIHVFYPTEQKGPLRLLLHAEFFVKSDRTALIHFDGSPFNAWVADRLASHVCKFVNAMYRPEAPSSHVALLAPFDGRDSHPVARDLWQRIAEKAITDLRLADVDGNQHLSIDKARLISVSVHSDLGRTLLDATDARGELLHSTFDENIEAREALRELGCKSIADQELLTAIGKNANSHIDDPEWIWTCWEWLSAWVAERPYGDEHKKRVADVKKLPVVPVDGKLLKGADLAGRIVTWTPKAGVDCLPDWLPLVFVKDWFRDRIRSLTELDHPVKKLCKELGIDGPDDNVIQRAVGQAIVQYWKDKRGDPGRFLRFILEQDWHETLEATEALKRCPVPLSQLVEENMWCEARLAYFGRDWENELLERLYAEVEGMAWVAFDGLGDEREQQRQVLNWLGVTDYPRVVEERQETAIRQLPEDCGEWKSYLSTVQDNEGRFVARVACVTNLDRLSLASLDLGKATLVIRLLARHWARYYCNYIEIKAKGSKGREQNYRQWQVNAKWWWDVCERLPIPRRDDRRDHIPLTSHWIPDKRTQQSIGDLLPVIDLSVFGEDENVVRNWLSNDVPHPLRKRIGETTLDDWKAILSNRIPEMAPIDRVASDEQVRDRIVKWYTACLEEVVNDENLLPGAFASCPLLCRKGDSWKYVAKERRYLDDDNTLVNAFAHDVWLFHISSNSRSAAKKYFDVLSLAESVEEQVNMEVQESSLPEELQVRLRESLGYVYAWRSTRSKQITENLSARLQELNGVVVATLNAKLTLENAQREVPRRWHVNEDKIYIHADHANEVELGQAVAKFVDAKSEADFYENLLRCNSDAQRMEKLVSKGIAAAEVESRLRDYGGRVFDEDHEDGRDESVGGASVSNAAQAHSQAQGNSEKNSSNDVGKPLFGGGTKPTQDEFSVRGQNDGGPGGSTGPSSSAKRPLRLKDPSASQYELANHQEAQPSLGSGGAGGARTEHEGSVLTEQEKAELEEAGRCFAEKALHDFGYSVEKMSQLNPGFDLRAFGNGEELRVEVKTHTGRATIVEITSRQYKEYLQKRSYRWELWNVEHLSADDANEVTITRYCEIPDDSLDARTFRVDLRKCRSPANQESNT
ncbi:MAG: hypothetical protein AMXMBFR84_33150 [Candidatus Hydrogenedentota bacterium]